MIKTRPEFKTKEALIRAIETGVVVTVYQGCCGGQVARSVVHIESKTWDAIVDLKNGRIINVR